MELVHDHDVGGHPRTAQGHVGKNLGGANQDGCVAVDRGVPGHQSDMLGTEGIAQIEELLVHQGLDRAAVETRLALAQGLVQEGRGHQRLARSGGGGQHDVFAGQDFEQRFFLRGVKRQPLAGGKIEKALEDLVVGDGSCRRRKRPWPRSLFGHGGATVVAICARAPGAPTLAGEPRDRSAASGAWVRNLPCGYRPRADGDRAGPRPRPACCPESSCRPRTRRRRAVRT